MAERLLSDETLINLMKEGDSHSFDILFDRYWKKLFTTVFSICPDREVCFEIVHDIFLNLWLKREKLQIEYFQAYILASARYHVYRHMKNAKRNAIEYRKDLDNIQQVAVNDGERRVRYHELERIVEKIIDHLPRRCKEIFTLSRRDQLSNTEIAARLDISKRTVENQLTHALRHLRVSIKQFLIFLMFVGV